MAYGIWHMAIRPYVHTSARIRPHHASPNDAGSPANLLTTGSFVRHEWPTGSSRLVVRATRRSVASVPALRPHPWGRAALGNTPRASRQTCFTNSERTHDAAHRWAVRLTDEPLYCPPADCPLR